MNCRDFEKIVSAFTRPESLERTAREQGIAHTKGCERCAARLSEEIALLAGVRTVVEAMAWERAPARVEAALLLALHERAATGSGSRVLQIPRKSERSRWIWEAAAAAVLALVSTLLVSWLQPRPVDEDRQAHGQASGPPVPTTPAPPGQITTAVTGSERNAHRSRRSSVRRTIRRHEEDGGEIATDFLPLLEGDDLDALEGSQLVRIELPGSALIAVGLQVGSEMASASVKADVLLGHDGLARAIRFVR